MNPLDQLPQINWQDSIIETICFNDQDYFLKRDDLLTPISGNKARKLHGLLQTDFSKYQRIISYGGAQSNAMLALAQFSQLFSSLTPWVCGSHTPSLSARLFRLLDQNQDGLVNFKEFVTGLSESTFTFSFI